MKRHYLLFINLKVSNLNIYTERLRLHISTFEYIFALIYLVITGNMMVPIFQGMGLLSMLMCIKVHHNDKSKHFHRFRILKFYEM